jgi:hypothetical protein
LIVPPEKFKNATNPRVSANKLRHYTDCYRFIFYAHLNCFKLRAIQKVIGELLQIKISQAFRQPVNAKLLMIPDYHDIVKRPMDLGIRILFRLSFLRNN